MSTSITCQKDGCSQVVDDPSALNRLMLALKQTCLTTTAMAESSAQDWADIAVKSKHPLAPLV